MQRSAMAGYYSDPIPSSALFAKIWQTSFADATLPPIDDALVIMPDGGALITVEVQAHLNESTVRGIALQSTMGLSRGVPARATGGRSR
jgi:F-type H+/Na+-transporting ATPase subunit beta